MSESPMTMNPKYLQYCKYYNGEETVPWNKSYDKFTRFWLLERDYYSAIYDEQHIYWETKGQKFCTQRLKKYISKFNNRTIAGFIAWATTMVSYNSPMEGEEFIFRY